MTDERKDRKPADVTETDLAQDRMGRNSLQANDQENVRNQRHAMPDGKRDPDDTVVESFRKMDKDVRARTDMNKGATHGKD
ncbi:hypothetical protein [Aquibium sp. ELW1220]|uniref:hypothetical protein n=1 Tax=Aquibium sp. ELW1220 TaxID=2976766 RepID=UPI0025B0ACD5|nr:hypothetical protein [Aquibium sp. ELW1220]MDN2578465.1 hypothetical protein [Aquibium sp. ELW1220]